MHGRGFFHGHNPGGPGMLDMFPNKISMKHVTDGSSNTLHVGETHGAVFGAQQPGCFSSNNWMGSFAVASTVWGINIDYLSTLGWSVTEHDRNNYTAGCNFRSNHPGGAQFLLVDGSVKFIEESILPTLLGNLGARNDGNIGAAYHPPESAGTGR
jgi:prepilin-type processing-associated H-X9-DG protein